MQAITSGKQGSIQDIVRQLRRNSAFRRGRFDMRGRRDANRMIIAIGQVHPVLQGRFEGFQVRRIARVQAWIFDVCHALVEYGVTAFGQEGLSSNTLGPGGQGVVYGRMSQEILDAWKKEVPTPEHAQSFLLRVARRWRAALHRGRAEEARKEASVLNGLALLQVFDPNVRMFPIEQHDVHSIIGQQVDALSRAIAQVEASAPYQRARSKDGRRLLKDEYQAMLQRNTLVRAFNGVLTHPERDRSIVREVLRFAEHHPITVYVLGQGHRRAQLRLMREHLPSDALFVWITPPQLWWWQAVLARIGWALLGALALGGVLRLTDVFS